MIFPKSYVAFSGIWWILRPRPEPVHGRRRRGRSPNDVPKPEPAANWPDECSWRRAASSGWGRSPIFWADWKRKRSSVSHVHRSRSAPSAPSPGRPPAAERSMGRSWVQRLQRSRDQSDPSGLQPVSIPTAFSAAATADGRKEKEKEEEQRRRGARVGQQLGSVRFRAASSATSPATPVARVNPDPARPSTSSEAARVEFRSEQRLHRKSGSLASIVTVSFPSTFIDLVNNILQLGSNDIHLRLSWRT